MWDLDQLYEKLLVWQDTVYWEDFYRYSLELRSQYIVSVHIPLWLKEHHEGDLYGEEADFHYIFEFLNKNKIEWLLLRDRHIDIIEGS